MRSILFSCLLLQHPFCRPWIKELFQILLRDTFHKAIAVTDGDSSDGSMQSKLKAFWKGFTLLDDIKNIHDSWEEVKISIFPALMDDFEEIKSSVEE